jgi:hypothetical protein
MRGLEDGCLEDKKIRTISPVKIQFLLTTIDMLRRMLVVDQEDALTFVDARSEESICRDELGDRGRFERGPTIQRPCR